MPNPLTPKLRFPEFAKDGAWVEDSLDNVATFAKGKSISKSDIIENGKTPCIRYGELYTLYGEIITDVKSTTNLDSKDLVLSEANDVIIPASGETQADIATASCVLKAGVALSGDLNIIRSEIDGVFLSYYLNYAKKREIAQVSQGISVVHLYSSQLKALKVSFPQPHEQQKIAACLSSLDGLIAAHNDKLQALKDHKKGLLQNLFPQKGQKMPNYRFPEFTNDGEWGLKQVQEYFDVGSSKRVLQKDWTNNGVPFYRTRELVSLSKNEQFRSEIYISKSLYSELKQKYGVPSEGDFLVSGVGTLGISYQVRQSDQFYFKDGNVLWFKLEGELDSTYFKFCFESEHIQNQIKAQTSKSTVGTYTIQNAKKTEFWNPPTPREQQKIASCLSAIDELVTAQAAKIEQLQQHKKGLMQGLFPKIEN